ncbi:MAG: YdcH family protein [Vicinamibacteria bacterium]|nr:YdcH family protein [Vicinamibacteria bacterium]
MAVDTHELKERLLQSDHEYRDLATRHQELDQRLHELLTRHFLTEPEQLEEAQIKKQKLRLKDRMEDIVRHHIYA